MSYPIAFSDKNARAPAAMPRAWEKILFTSDPLTIFLKNLYLVDIQRVGRYAVRLVWNDGHRTGIYTFEFLRELSESSSKTPDVC